MADLKDFRVAILATDGFEESELTEPMQALRNAGARVDVVAPKQGRIQAFRHHDKSITVPVDRTLEEAHADEYDAIMLPGGALNADALRVNQRALAFIRETDSVGKPVAAICHAPWELVSAGLAGNRTLTSYFTIQDDLRNAGANWKDQEVVNDRNWVTSRQPDDLPAFNREMIRVFGESRKEAHK